MMLERDKKSGVSPVALLLFGADRLFVYATVKLFGRLAYRSEYLTGRFFE